MFYGSDDYEEDAFFAYPRASRKEVERRRDNAERALRGGMTSGEQSAYAGWTKAQKEVERLGAECERLQKELTKLQAQSRDLVPRAMYDLECSRADAALRAERQWRKIAKHESEEAEKYMRQRNEAARVVGELKNALMAHHEEHEK